MYEIYWTTHAHTHTHDSSNVLLIQLCLLLKLKIKLFRKQTSSCIFQWSYIHGWRVSLVRLWCEYFCFFSQPFVCLSGSGETNQSNAVRAAYLFFYFFQEQIGENSIATCFFFLQSLRVWNKCMDAAAWDGNVKYKVYEKKLEKNLSFGVVITRIPCFILLFMHINCSFSLRIRLLFLYMPSF